MTPNVAIKTPVNYRPAISLKSSDLSVSIKETVSKIIAFVNKYNLEAPYLEKLLSYYFDDDISRMTKTAKKKLARKIRRVNFKTSLRYSNIFLSFLKTRVMTVQVESLKIAPSKAEQEIIAARENYKKLRSELEKIRINYKTKKKEYRAAGNKYVAS